MGTTAQDQRYVLCRPDAGLNDILCQIELMHRYADRSGRILIVDTAYANSITFKDEMCNYFTSKESNLVLSARNLIESFDSMVVFPPALQGRVNGYYPWVRDERDEIVDWETGIPVSFDMSMDYPHQLLVHHAYGGGAISLFALTKLTINDNIIDQLVERMDTIGSPYSAIHIRNTDYKTNYKPTIERLRNSVLTPVFISTDSLECRNYCEQAFGAQNVLYFSKIPHDGKAIHYNQGFSDIFQRNADAILDLLMLALSSRFHRVSRDGSPDGAVRGYSMLAENLFTYDGILLSLFGTSSRALTILKRAIEWRKQAR